MANDVDLRQFLEQREELIVRKREELKRELEELRHVRASLESGRHMLARNEHREKLTIKEMIRAVLEQNPTGGTSDQIVSWISQTFDNEVARSSLSPQLSRLKSEGEVDLDDELGKWRLRYHSSGKNLAQKMRERDEEVHREHLRTIGRIGGQY